MSDSDVPNVLLDSLVSITWDECSNIEVSSIVFTLLDNFTFSIVFRTSQLVQLSDISVIGDGGVGCSAVMSHESSVAIRDSKFVGVHGLFNYGAALMMSASNLTVTGNNIFISNAASCGGSIYLYNGLLKLNGSNHFVNNIAHGKREFLVSTCNYDTTTVLYYAGGGAIAFAESTVIVAIDGYSSFEGNTAHSKSLRDGGAIAARDGTISLFGSISFHSNHAHNGGAMYLRSISLILYGNVSLVNNSAELNGGALYISDTNILFNSNHTLSHRSITPTSESMVTDIIFQQNTATNVGGAISAGDANNILIITGNIIFIANTAFDGGAIGSEQISYIEMILVPVLNISFIMNHAYDSGGALYFGDSECYSSEGPTAPVPLQCFISILNHSSYPNEINITLYFKLNSARSRSFE